MTLAGHSSFSHRSRIFPFGSMRVEVRPWHLAQGTKHGASRWGARLQDDQDQIKLRLRASLGMPAHVASGHYRTQRRGQDCGHRLRFSLRVIPVKPRLHETKKSPLVKNRVSIFTVNEHISFDGPQTNNSHSYRGWSFTGIRKLLFCFSSSHYRSKN